MYYSLLHTTFNATVQLPIPSTPPTPLFHPPKRLMRSPRCWRQRLGTVAQPSAAPRLPSAPAAPELQRFRRYWRCPRCQILQSHLHSRVCQLKLQIQLTEAASQSISKLLWMLERQDSFQMLAAFPWVRTGLDLTFLSKHSRTERQSLNTVTLGNQVPASNCTVGE